MKNNNALITSQLTAMKKQQGIVLFIAMVILIMLALLGLYVTKSSVMQLKMADNTGSKTKTLEYAEASRSYAEAQVIALGNNMSGGSAYTCAVGYFSRVTPVISGCSALNISALDWQAGAVTVPNTDNKQRFVVEYLGVDDINEVGDDVQQGLPEDTTVEVHVFRIITQGIEPSGSETVVETIYLVRKS